MPSFGAARNNPPGPKRHPNSEKYRDTSVKPATGRSGSAAIAVEAMVSQTGLTTLTVTSYRATDLNTPLGSITKVQVKAFSPSGRLLFTRDFNHLTVGNFFQTTFPGFVAGTSFQVQANVTGIDGKRTDVVTVGSPPGKGGGGGGGGPPPKTIRAPDLSVTSISAPATVLVGTQVVISATVAELNGQHGAHGDCSLFLNGTLVDQAVGIWVDAGDVVSCLFTPTLSTAGTQQVVVAITGVHPPDFNLNNNADTVFINVVSPTVVQGPKFSYMADIRDITFTKGDTNSTMYTFVDGDSLLSDFGMASSSSGHEQSALFNGFIQTAVSFPLTKVLVQQTTGGVLLHSATYSNLAADPGSSTLAACASRLDAGGVGFFICAQSGFTTISYVRNAGTVTYSSANFAKEYSFDTGTYTMHADTTLATTTSTGTITTWGNNFSFTVEVHDGNAVYSVSTTAPLTAVSQTVSQPRTCFPSETFFLFPGGPLIRSSVCQASFFSVSGKTGGSTGEGISLVTVTP